MVPKHVAASIDRWFDKDDELTFFERITLQQEGEEKYLDEPFAIRFGHILEHVVSNMSIIINEGERIVGSVKEIIPSAEEREWAESLSRKWWGDHVSEEQRQESVSYYFSPGWVKRRNPKFFSLGHLAYDWETLITEGLGSYIQRVESIIEKGTYADDPDRSDFLRGALIAYNAHVLFIKRYADHAENLSALTVDQGERNRFKEIAERCAHIAEGKPRTFAEALQLIWFVALISQKIAGCGVFNFSRMDQYLKPFYDNDIAKKKLDPELALELIIEFYAKNNEIMFLADHMSQETEAVIKNLELTYDDPNYITLAGKLADGTSGVNELSFLFIRASALLKLKNPFVVVRWHDGISSSFFKEVVNAMRKNATIVIYNDETMLPALEEFGIEWSDAIDYGFYGCNDPSIGALEGGLRQLWMNLVWPYELALNGGIPFGNPDARAEDNFSLKDRIQIGLMSGYVAGRAFDTDEPVKSMEAFIELYREQMVFLLEQYRTIMEQDYKKETKWNAGKIRIEDLFLRGTIEHGETWITGGTKYHKVTIQGSGLATAINSLAAIDEAVFIQKRYTLDQLREAVATNFEGHTEMRTYLLLLPKFGNDDERVDRYAPIVVNAFADAVRTMNANRKGLYTYMPAISTDRDYTIMGRWLAASADGRLAGEPISENQSPSVGDDVKGLTALLNSLAQVPFDRIAGGPLNLRISPSAIEGEKGLEKLEALLSVYFQNGGMQVQINVVSKQELLDAQQHPERYRNLCVRVVGYAAYFVQMGEKAQQELIDRTEL